MIATLNNAEHCLGVMLLTFDLTVNIRRLVNRDFNARFESDSSVKLALLGRVGKRASSSTSPSPVQVSDGVGNLVDPLISISVRSSFRRRSCTGHEHRLCLREFDC